MFTNAKLLTLAVCATAAVLASQSADAKPSYSAKIPNGEAMGKALGHTDGGDYTAFGTMFSKAGLSWSAVCKQNWPGASVTVGAALGDPCCKWTGSGAPEKTLSAPDTSAAACAAGPAPATVTTAPASPAAQTTTKAPAAAVTTAPTTAPAANATPKVTPASTKTGGGGGGGASAGGNAKLPVQPTIPGGQLCE